MRPIWWLKPRWWHEIPFRRGMRPQNGDVWRLEALRHAWGMTHETFAARLGATPRFMRVDLEGRYRSLTRSCPPGTLETEILQSLLVEALGIVGLPWSESRVDAAMAWITSVDDIWFLVVQQLRQQTGEVAYDEFTARTRLG